MEEDILELYKCLSCQTTGDHNHNTDQDGDINENDWAAYSETLECENCGEVETIDGFIDGGDNINIASWTNFEKVYRKRVHIINQSNTSENSSEKVQSIETKGKEGEDAFNSWLNNNGLSFLYVDQSVDTFSTLFKNNVKRPDFLLMLESIGMLAVDVKNYTQSQGTYTLNMEQEFLRSLSFERLFRIPLWYAYKSEKNGETIWLWISALKAIEVGSISLNNRSGEKFLRIDVKHFEEIKTNQDIGKLYTHRLPSLNNLSI